MQIPPGWCKLDCIPHETTLHGETKTVKHLSRLLLLPLILAFAPPSLGAPAGDATDSRLQQLLDDLNRQLDRAEKQRLADPWFLRDLRQLVNRYDYPWRQTVLLDDFSGRGSRPAPPWKLRSGEFLIDWRYGMRSVVRPSVTRNTGRVQKQGNAGGEDIAAALLGALIEQAVSGKQKKRGDSGTVTSASPDGQARIDAVTRIPNAFALETELTSRPVSGSERGSLALGPYRNGANAAGYRLVYHPGAGKGENSIELIRVSPRGGRSLLELYKQPLKLADGQPHKLSWTRDRGGNMVVAVDGRQLFQVTDRSYRGPFDGFTVINAGGDFAFRKFRLDGAP